MTTNTSTSTSTAAATTTPATIVYFDRAAAGAGRIPTCVGISIDNRTASTAPRADRVEAAKLEAGWLLESDDVTQANSRGYVDDCEAIKVARDYPHYVIRKLAYWAPRGIVDPADNARAQS
jgi:hypothetical protein